MRTDFIADANSPRKDRIYEDYISANAGDITDFVRNDTLIEYSVQPVVRTPAGSPTPLVADYESTDTFRIGVGPVDTQPTSGTFRLIVNGTDTGLTQLDYNITAANLQTALSARFSANSKPGCTVTEIADGVYQVDAISNGAVTAGFLVSDNTNLVPSSAVTIAEQTLGSASSKYQYLIVIRQLPIAYSEPVEALPDAGVSSDPIQTGSATENRIEEISFVAPDTYGGAFTVDAVVAPQTLTIESVSVANPTVITFTGNHGLESGMQILIPNNNGSTPTIAGLHTFTKTGADTGTIPVHVTIAGSASVTAGRHLAATCGIANPLMTAEEFSTVLAGHPLIKYQDSNGSPNNIKVTKQSGKFQIEYIGTLGLSSWPSTGATNIDLLAPKGRIGFLNLNTTSLYKYSLTQSGASFELPFSIQRERANGEVKTLVLAKITIQKDILDITSLVPVPTPSYYTATQINQKFTTSNLLYVDKAGTDSTGARGRFDLPFESIAAAVDAAEAGDTIVIRPGTYVDPATGLIAIKASCTVIGLGGVTIDVSAGDGIVLAENASMRHVDVITSDDATCPVSITGTDGAVEFTHCRITGLIDAVIHNGSSLAIFRGCELTSNQDAYFTQGSAGNAKFYNSRIRVYGGNGIANTLKAIGLTSGGHVELWNCDVEADGLAVAQPAYAIRLDTGTIRIANSRITARSDAGTALPIYGGTEVTAIHASVILAGDGATYSVTSSAPNTVIPAFASVFNLAPDSNTSLKGALIDADAA